MPSPEPRRYLVRTYGCQMNEHDSESLAGLLEADGLEAAARAEDADVIVLNTCCIRENADDRLYGALGHLKRLKAERPELEIVVGGCLAQKDRDLVRQRAPHVDVVLGTHNVRRAVELLHESRRNGPLTEIWDAAPPDDDPFPSALPRRRDSAHAAWVTIQIGCDNSCAFCIVPAVRGREVSRPYADLVDEVTNLAAAGVTEITLLGQNVNSYGRDLSRARRRAGSAETIRPHFAELLRTLSQVDGIRRIRFTSPHPKDLRPEVIEAMASVPAVCEHLHLPLQSGSDTVLAAMHRGYSADRYLERLASARAAVDDLAVTTDVIVGFPGETEADFSRTLEVVAEADYDSAYTFIFSPRSGTEAAGRVDAFVAAEVIAERFARLVTVVERSAQRRHEARIGRVEEVVVEGPARRDPELTSGRSRQNKVVLFRTADPPAVGSYANVRIAAAGPHHLRGELVGVTMAPRHRARIRIPVAAG